MKKINRFLIIYMIVITVLCAYMCYLAFTRNENILNMLKENFVFENREEVYHFLESYSS